MAERGLVFIFLMEEGPAGGKPSSKKKQLFDGVFRKRGKTASNKYLTRRDGRSRPFFYALPEALFAITISHFLSFNLKIGI